MSLVCQSYNLLIHTSSPRAITLNQPPPFIEICQCLWFNMQLCFFQASCWLWLLWLLAASAKIPHIVYSRGKVTRRGPGWSETVVHGKVKILLSFSGKWTLRLSTWVKERENHLSTEMRANEQRSWCCESDTIEISVVRVVCLIASTYTPSKAVRGYC